MSDATETPETTEESTQSAKGGSNKMIIIILGGVITLLLVAIIVLFVTPLGKKLMGHEEAAHEAKHEAKESAEEKIDPAKIAFINLPEVLITLRSKDGKGGFLKASFVIQASSEEIGQKIEKLKPLILDQVQIYLRELDLEDMRGSAGLQRVRQDLTSRVNNIVAPEKILGVLVKDFILQ